MDFIARKRGRKNTDQQKIASCRAQDMRIVPVQGVNGAGTDWKNFTGLRIFDLTFTGNAIIGLKMVLVMQMQFRALLDARFVHGMTHAIIAHDHAAAFPSRSRSIPCRTRDFVGCNNNHDLSLMVISHGLLKVTDQWFQYTGHGEEGIIATPYSRQHQADGKFANRQGNAGQIQTVGEFG